MITKGTYFKSYNIILLLLHFTVATRVCRRSGEKPADSERGERAKNHHRVGVNGTAAAAAVVLGNRHTVRELARASTRCSGFGCVCRVCVPPAQTDTIP